MAYIPKSPCNQSSPLAAQYMYVVNAQRNVTFLFGWKRSNTVSICFSDHALVRLYSAKCMIVTSCRAIYTTLVRCGDYNSACGFPLAWNLIRRKIARTHILPVSLSLYPSPIHHGVPLFVTAKFATQVKEKSTIKANRCPKVEEQSRALGALQHIGSARRYC